MAVDVKKVSFRFAQEMSKMIDDETNILIADYRIIFSIIYISQSKAQKLNIAYFHNEQFPDIESLAILPFGDKLVSAILCSNLVSFTNFEAAANFLRYLRVKLKLSCESVRGNLRLFYMGN
jgi:trehalose-6-phosphate synthase